MCGLKYPVGLGKIVFCLSTFYFFSDCMISDPALNGINKLSDTMISRDDALKEYFKSLAILSVRCPNVKEMLSFSFSIIASDEARQDCDRLTTNCAKMNFLDRKSVESCNKLISLAPCDGITSSTISIFSAHGKNVQYYTGTFLICAHALKGNPGMAIGF